jgi:hypothetical protein
MKKLFCVLSALVLILFCVIVCSSTANAASAGATMGNAVKIIFDNTYTKTWTKDTDHLNHYSKITVTEQGYITITASKPFDSEGEYGEIEFTLYNSEGEPFWGNESRYSADSARNDYKYKVGLAPGVYYLTMKPGFYVTSGTIVTNYSISFKKDDHCEIEPNNSGEIATTIKLGQKYTGWYGSEQSDYELNDYFKIYVAAGNTYRISWYNYSKLSAADLTHVDFIMPDGNKERLNYYLGDKVDENGLNYVDVNVKTSGFAYIRISEGEYYPQFEYGFVVTNRTCANKGHSFGSWQVTQAATCKTEGIKARNCSGCGATETQTIGITTHSYNAWTVIREATCENEGEKQRACTGCGKKEYQVIPLIAHSIGNWVDTRVATCTDEGEQQRSCANCSYKETRATAKKAHSYSDWQETKTATCTSEGEEQRTCSGCDKKETRTIAILAHNWGKWTEIVASTCTSEGEQQRTCSGCDKKETKTIAMKSHSFGAWEDIIAATCTADGEKARICIDCGLEETMQISKTDHTYTNWTTLSEATCQTSGKQIRECSTCNLEESRQLDKIAHSYGEWTIAKEPTCSQKGQKISICTGCGTQQSMPLDINKNNHTPGDVATKKDPQVCLDCHQILVAATGSDSTPVIVGVAVGAVALMCVVMILVVKKKK